VIERRAEVRLWCSDLIQVFTGEAETVKLVGNLEDICPSGACVQFEQPLAPGTRVVLKMGRRKFRGRVEHCAHEDLGYFVGVRFDADCRWSRELYEPQHLLDPRQVAARKR
jgi:hypothetical protein